VYKIFTAATPFAIGLFDRHRSAQTLLRFPKLYKMSQTSANFNSRVNKCCTCLRSHFHIIFYLFISYQTKNVCLFFLLSAVHSPQKERSYVIYASVISGDQEGRNSH